MKKNCFWGDEKAINTITQILQNDGIIASSTDTVWGLLAPLTHAGYTRLNEIKQRSDKPYLVLVPSLEKAKHFSDALEEPQIAKLIDAYWPGPLTIIVKAKDDLPDYMKSKNNTIALRWPKHQGLQAVLSHFYGLFSTSANLAQKPVACTVDQLDEAITNNVAAIVIDREEKPSCLPSTLIDCTQTPIKIIREGAIKIPGNTQGP